MKKIVGIIAALALVAGTAFAGEPALNVTDFSFSGKASLEWIADLDAETTGMKNNADADFKLEFLKEGTKASTGDGVWGFIEIKAAKVEANNGDPLKTVKPTVEKAQINFMEDDFILNMSILKPGLGIGGGDINTATAGKKAFPKAEVTITGAQGFKLNFGKKML
jgi:hypothetical protein